MTALAAGISVHLENGILNLTSSHTITALRINGAQRPLGERLVFPFGGLAEAFTVQCETCKGRGYHTHEAPVADQAPTTDFVLTAGDLDQPALAALAALCPQPLGLRLGEESPTGRDLLDRIAAGVGAWIDATPAGHLTAGRYAGPADVADHALDPRHLLAPPRRVAAGPAQWRRRIGARRCWRVHGPAEIAAAAPEAVRAFLLQEWREGFAEDAAVRTADPGAEEAFVEGLFDRREDAAAEAARQLALRSPDALAFQVETTLRALPWRLGRTVALTCPEAGLAQPRRMVLLARDVRLADDRVTLTLLG